MGRCSTRVRSDEAADVDSCGQSGPQSICHLSLFNEALPLLYNLHQIGVQLSDDHITTVVSDLCMHVQESSANV